MSGESNNDAAGRRMAGWTALVSFPIAGLTLYALFASVGFDPEAIFRPNQALTLSPASVRLFRWGMLADCFSFYLPFLVTGGYLWSRLGRTPLIDIATMFLVIYVLLGVAGAAIQLATLPALTELHASGDAMAQSAAEATWLAVVHGTQSGLWWMEGPLMAFWAIVVGSASKAAGLRYGRLLTLGGIAYGIYFILAFAGAHEIAGLFMFAGILLLPLWMLLVGIGLLQEGHWDAPEDNQDAVAA